MNLNAIMVPITDCLKNEGFQWTHVATKVFKEVKRLMIEAYVMHLTDFSKVIEVTCDTSRLAISGVMSQENHLIAYFSEKLNDT